MTKGLISDLCLTLFMPFTIIFGVFIARELFVFPAWLPFSLAFTIHNTLSYACLWVMCIHLLLHVKYLAGVFKKLPLTTGRELGAAALRASATAAAAVAVYAGLALYKSLPDRAVSAAPEKIPQSAFSSPSPLPSSTSSAAPTVPPLITPAPRPTTVPQSTPPEEQGSDSESPVSQQQVPAGEQSSIAAQNDSVIIEETPESTPPVPSLQEYLSGLFCGGCGKNCPLLSPRCGRGQELAQTAEEEYYAMYPVSAGE